MIINHASLNWGNFIPKNVKTLVLGSFNPNNHIGQNANYYYGRNTNYLWKAIGDILFHDQQYFFNNGLLNYELAIQTMDKYSFCFLDLMSSIQITGNNEQHENNFRDAIIYNTFSDTVLFTTNTDFENFNINIQRNYNQHVISFLRKYKPEKLIHSLGNGRINLNFNAPLADLGHFLNQISNTCQQTHSQIIPLSISPSQTNINRFNKYPDLYNWLLENLNLQ